MVRPDIAKKEQGGQTLPSLLFHDRKYSSGCGRLAGHFLLIVRVRSFFDGLYERSVTLRLRNGRTAFALLRDIVDIAASRSKTPPGRVRRSL